jgi:hypothetical protein
VKVEPDMLKLGLGNVRTELARFLLTSACSLGWLRCGFLAILASNGKQHLALSLSAIAPLLRPSRSCFFLGNAAAERAADDTAPILVPDGAGIWTFGDHLRHLAGHAGTIPLALDEYGRCLICVRRGFFTPNA